MLLKKWDLGVIFSVKAASGCICFIFGSAIVLRLLQEASEFELGGPQSARRNHCTNGGHDAGSCPSRRRSSSSRTVLQSVSLDGANPVPQDDGGASIDG
jgi:hypothetical protein